MQKFPFFRGASASASEKRRWKVSFVGGHKKVVSETNSSATLVIRSGLPLSGSVPGKKAGM